MTWKLPDTVFDLTLPLAMGGDNIVAVQSPTGTVLLDTGSPVTISYPGNPDVLLGVEKGKEIRLTPNPAGRWVDLQKMASEKVGLELHGIVGLDWLRNYVLTVDWQAKTARIQARNEYLRPLVGKPHSLYLFMAGGLMGPSTKAPVINLSIRSNGDRVTSVPMLIDTGATVSFLPPRLLEQLGAEPTNETYDDYSPFTGRFKSHMHKLTAEIGGHPAEDMIVTALPSLLSSHIRAAVGGTGIIGCQLLRQMRTQIDFEDGVVLFDRLNFRPTYVPKDVATMGE